MVVIFVLVMIIFVCFFLFEKCGYVLGIFVIGIVFGVVFGLIIVGFVLSVLNWKFFFVIFLFFLFVLFFYRRYLDDELVFNVKIDYVGGVLLVGMVVIFLFVFLKVNIWLVVIGIIILVLFILWICYVFDFFVNLVIFRNK